MSWFSVNAPPVQGSVSGVANPSAGEDLLRRINAGEQFQQPLSGGGERIGVGGPAQTFPTGGDQQLRYPTGESGGGAPGTYVPNGGGSGGGDYQSTFMRIMGGLPATPANLAAKEQELAAAGIQVKRNAEGTAGKIKLPTGQIVDVIQSAGTGGGGNWQWLTGSGGSGMGAGGNIPGFEVGSFTGGGQYPLASVMGTGLAAPWTTPFNAPDPNSVINDKALQFQMGRGMDAIQRSAASKGTLLTGGLLKKLDEFGQGLASTYYNDVYNRKLGEYKMAHDIFNENQGNLFNRLGYLGSIGENAAAGVGNAQIGLGNAQGQGSIAQGNIWGNAIGGAGTLAGNIFGALNQPKVNQQYDPGMSSYPPGRFYPPGTFTP